MATLALPSVGASRTFSMGWSRRATNAWSMVAERFVVWHGVEQRADVWASAGAFVFAGVATVVAFAVGPF